MAPAALICPRATRAAVERMVLATSTRLLANSQSGEYGALSLWVLLLPRNTASSPRRGPLPALRLRATRQLPAISSIEDHRLVRHSNFIKQTSGEIRRRVQVIGRLPGEASCLTSSGPFSTGRPAAGTA